MTEYVIGIDYGSDSARGLLVDVRTGETAATVTALYPRWAKGMYSNPEESRFRHHPKDYMEVLQEILNSLVEQCPKKENILSISVDTTASTPCMVDEHCTPLSLKDAFAEDPDAMFVLWKDHTATAEAAQITKLCSESEVNYSAECGYHYSAEAYWSKVLHILRTNESVRAGAFAALELCDWIPALLTGCNDTLKVKHSHCAAGCKHLWGEPWGGYPPESFFAQLDPVLLPLYRNLPACNYASQEVFGNLSDEWKQKLGLNQDVTVTVGNVDGHSGAVGGGVREGTMVMSLGTSSCYMAVSNKPEYRTDFIKGVYGQAEGAIIPGMVGFEVGMSAFGDIFAWFKNLLSDTVCSILPEAEAAKDRILANLASKASLLEPSMDLPVATDFFNGRRSPNPSNFLTASITKLRIATGAAEIYYALVEAAAFATKANVDLLTDNGIEIKHLVAVGGIAHKSPFVVQMIADVTHMPVEISDCRDSCALGAVLNASVAAGRYPDLRTAQDAICPAISKVYYPNESRYEMLMKRYQLYKAIDNFTDALQGFRL